jgi:hypothetical protein
LISLLEPGYFHAYISLKLALIPNARNKRPPTLPASLDGVKASYHAMGWSREWKGKRLILLIGEVEEEVVQRLGQCWMSKTAPSL